MKRLCSLALTVLASGGCVLEAATEEDLDASLELCDEADGQPSEAQEDGGPPDDQSGEATKPPPFRLPPIVGLATSGGNLSANPRPQPVRN